MHPICLYRNPHQSTKVAYWVQAISNELINKNIPFTITGNLSKAEPSKVYAIGGDGTFHKCINEINHLPIIHFIQSGTGNDWIRNFDNTVVNEDQNYFVDSLKVNHHKALNSMGVGFDALIAKKSHAFPSFLSAVKYLLPVLYYLFVYREKYWEIIADNKKLSGRFFMVSIGNGSFAGGGFNLFPNANITDGKMDVLVIKKCNLFKRLLYLLKVMNGKHTQLDVVEYFQCNRLEIKSNHSFTYQCDGEIYENAYLHVEIQPQSIKTINKPL